MKKIMQNVTTKKLLALAVLILIFLPILASVNSLVQDREYRQEESVRDISQKWGSRQTVSGPVIAVPEKYQTDVYHYFNPAELTIEADIKTDNRTRGIYNVPVYTADVKLTGFFDDTTIQSQVLSNRLMWDQAKLVFGISDMHGLTEIPTINYRNQSLEASTVTRGISSAISVDSKDLSKKEFEISYKLKGSQEFFVNPLSKATKVNIKSDWKSPSFDGSFLPTEHNIADNGFDANWSVLDINTSTSRYWTKKGTLSIVEQSNGYHNHGDTFGVKLFVENDIYSKVERAVKYGIAIVVLVFVIFFMIEMIANKRVHPFQYLLIGLALVIFYTLLLSLSEYISFAAAYIISALAIIAMITTFSKKVLNDNKLAYSNSAILALLYTFIMILLESEDYTLLIGSIGLFVILGLVMHFSHKIEWYSE